MNNNLIIAAIILVLVIAVAYLVFFSKPSVASDEFAKCLTKEGAVFYGSYQCGHCATQKEMFGSSIQYVNYVECGPLGAPPSNEACTQVGIEAYPTWIINGIKYVGVQQLIKLSELTGCDL